MINLTDSAITEILRLKHYTADERAYLRIRVSEGGCADFLYKLDFDDQVLEGDRTFNHHEQVAIVVDEKSYHHVQNLIIDYAEDLMGGSFQYQNPQAQSHCNCGISFSVAPN